jgi:hypothetical protein
MNTQATRLFVEFVGWYGAAAVLGAYLLLSLEMIQVDVLYHCLNATGAAGIGLISWMKRAWQPLALNVIWAGTAVTALLRAGF